jgi:hypothetical protein
MHAADVSPHADQMVGLSVSMAEVLFRVGTGSADIANRMFG